MFARYLLVPVAMCSLSAWAMSSENLQFLDLNKDGYIDRQEIKGIPDLTERWEELDRDGDNRLDATEFARFEEVDPAPADD